MIEIPYAGRTNAKGDVFWTPMVTVVIDGPLGPMQAQAVVDTGADATHIPRGFAEQLAARMGRPLESFDSTQLTVSGAHDAADTMLRIDGDWTATVEGERVPIRPMIGNWSDNVFLGMDFLEHFAATFHGPARRLRLERAEVKLPPL